MQTVTTSLLLFALCCTTSWTMTATRSLVCVVLFTLPRLATLGTEFAVDAIGSARLSIAIPMPPRMCVAHANITTFPSVFALGIPPSKKLVAGAGIEPADIYLMRVASRLCSIPANQMYHCFGFNRKNYSALFTFECLLRSFLSSQER